MNDRKFRRIFADLPTVKTDRLVLKKITADNAEDMFSYASLDTVTRYLLWTPHLNIDDTKGYIEFLSRQYKRGNYADWGINLAEGTFIGTVGFADVDFNNSKVELGYVLNPEYQGKGYMTEAINAVLDIAFNQICFEKAELRIMDGNFASRKLASRLGFTLASVIRDELLVKGEYKTICHYEMTLDEYKAQNKNPTE